MASERFACGTRPPRPSVAPGGGSSPGGVSRPAEGGWATWFADEARALRDFTVAVTLEICRRRTVNYHPEDYPGAGPDDMPAPGCESRVIEYLAPLIALWGLPVATPTRVPGRANLVTSVGRGDPAYRHLLVLLHSDTVPSGGRELWDFDPFEPFERDGMLYGRGVLDNKGPLAASLTALRLLHAHRDALAGRFTFGVVADEEVGAAGAGFEHVFAEGRFAGCTDAVIPDIAGEMQTLDVAEKGRAILRLEAHGLQAHAMQPEQGRNAIVGLAKLLVALEDHPFRFTPHPVLGTPTMNIGLIKGGSSPNNVPAFAEAIVDCRLVPGMSGAGVIEEFQAVAARLDARDVRFEFSVRSEAPATALRADAPVKAAIRAVRPDVQEKGMGGGTFCKPLLLAGVDAVGWAPGHGRTYHMANEEIAVEQLVDFSAALAQVAMDLCNRRRA